MLSDFVVDNNVDMKRTDKSLGILTRKFVQILQKTSNGVLDLKYAADTLNVKQKRRIYDITNVLEGIGLIEKKSKNSIQWKGFDRETTSTPEQISNQVKLLEEQLAEIKEKEALLEKHSLLLEFNLRCMQSDPQCRYYSYVTWDDLVKCYGNNMVLTIRNYDLYQSTIRNVPNFEGHLQLQSDSQPIEVKLVLNEERDPFSEPTKAIGNVSDTKSSQHKSRKRPLGRKKDDDLGSIRDDSPDTIERNISAKILFSQIDNQFKRDFDNDNFFDHKESTRLYRLCPPPNYVYVLRKDEGLCDLYEDHL